MRDEIASAVLQRLIGVNKSVLAELVTRGIVQRGEKRGTYKLDADNKLLAGLGLFVFVIEVVRRAYLQHQAGETVVPVPTLTTNP